MTDGLAGFKGHLAGPLILLLLALLSGPVEAADGDGLSIEDQLYITAGLLGGLAFVLTIAVVYLLLTLNRIQIDVFKLQDTIHKQEQQQQRQQRPTIERVEGSNGAREPEEPPTQTQIQTSPQSRQLSQPQSQPVPQFQPMSHSQAMSQPQALSQPQTPSQPQTTYMPQTQAAPNGAPQLQPNEAQNSLYQRQSSFQPASSPGHAPAPLGQQPYRGAQRPDTAIPRGNLRQEPSYQGGQYRTDAVPTYGFPQPSQNLSHPQQYRQSANVSPDGAYGGRSDSQPEPYFASRAPAAPNPYVSSGPIYPHDRY